MEAGLGLTAACLPSWYGLFRTKALESRDSGVCVSRRGDGASPEVKADQGLEGLWNWGRAECWL